MVEYGFMEGTYLRSRFIEPYTEIRVNEDGENYSHEVSVEEQISNLSSDWKPVDKIDPERLKTEQGFIVAVEPYDAGDHIAYRYIKKEDIQAVKKEISVLKEQLTDTDYQVIKCYEASLLGEVMPYNVTELINSRQAARNKINHLEELL